MLEWTLRQYPNVFRHGPNAYAYLDAARGIAVYVSIPRWWFFREVRFWFPSDAPAETFEVAVRLAMQVSKRLRCEVWDGQLDMQLTEDSVSDARQRFLEWRQMRREPAEHADEAIAREWIVRGQVAEATGQLVLAIERYRKVLELTVSDVTKARAWSEMGVCYWLSDSIMDAIGCLRTSLNMVRLPQAEVALAALYVMHDLRDRFDEAEQLLNHALSVEPHFPLAYFIRCALRLEQGRVEEARHALTVARMLWRKQQRMGTLPPGATAHRIVRMCRMMERSLERKRFEEHRR
ncbi:MAG TPA: tetratricopeptide repeat protein [Armatimonadetes bacterium]|nr:tetratricopeptide repeat protein [Armatimonadota bacterium]